MAAMVRKQIYIQRRQEAMLKRLARTLGVSEAALLRQALDDRMSGGSRTARAQPDAWEQARRFMLALHARGPIPGRPRTWTRDALYEERMSRRAGRSG
jgi:hypothetical protein